MFGMTIKGTADAVGIKDAEVPEFSKKSKAKHLELLEAAGGKPTISTSILEAAYLRVKNNRATREGSQYISHANLIKTYAINQEYKDYLAN